jgi:hypothetical protein
MKSKEGEKNWPHIGTCNIRVLFPDSELEICFISVGIFCVTYYHTDMENAVLVECGGCCKSLLSHMELDFTHNWMCMVNDSKRKDKLFFGIYMRNGFQL